MGGEEQGLKRGKGDGDLGLAGVVLVPILLNGALLRRDRAVVD